MNYGMLEMIQNHKIAIVILNLNDYDLTSKCLESLALIIHRNTTVILVDNGSEDGSSQRLADEFKWVTFLYSHKNVGFSRGNNIGIKYALAQGNEYILLLNNDTIVTPLFLEPLIHYAEENPTTGICVPKLLKYSNPKIIDSAGHIFMHGIIIDRGKNELDTGQYAVPDEVIGGCAAAVLYRSKMLQEIGLLDESIFMYYEDADLSWRAYNHGWKAIFVPDSIVYHNRAGTVNMNRNPKLTAALRGVSIQNMAKIVLRHGTIKQKLVFFVFYFPFVLLKFFIRAMTHKDGYLSFLYLFRNQMNVKE